MPAIVVLGAHWGDEGKGKIVDLLSQDAQMVVRFSGGDNAGHTVVNDQGTFNLHNVPSGIFSPVAKCVIGNGVVLNPQSFFEELSALEARGVDVERIIVSDKAHLVLPYHLMQDGLEEAARGDVAIGTTKRGIGPAYADRAARNGIRVGDLLDDDALAVRLGVVLDAKNPILGLHGAEAPPFDEIYHQCREFGERLRPYVVQTEKLVNEALDRGETVIFEGAQGTLLDLQFGTYPFVTSSDTTAAGVYTGAGLRPRQLDVILGVFKAYTSRVGTGPMPSELLDETGERIRQQAHEFGVTTGRPRRVGWFDAVAGKFAVETNGMTCGALTRIDMLDDFDTVKVCSSYRLDGSVVDSFPASEALLSRCEPIYDELPGWKQPTAHLRNYDDLPAEAKSYIRHLERLVGCPMNLISVGPHRDETICVRPIV